MATFGLAGVLGLTVSACGTVGPSQTASLERSGALIASAPLVTASPTVFVMGEPTTVTLPTGQSVTMTVSGPVLTNPIAGAKVQFANVLTETFTVTASTTSPTPVTFAAADFALERFNTPNAILTGPAATIVTAAAPQTWTVALAQTPGQGYFIWRYHGTTVANWSYVAEND